MKFVPIKAVLNYISEAIQEEQQSEMQLLSWAFQGLRSIDFPQRFERKVCILEIKDHKTLLPFGWRELNMVSQLCNKPKEEELVSLIYCTKEKFEEDCKDVEKKVCKLPLAYGMFIHSSYYNNNYKPMSVKLKQTKGLSERLCNLKNCQSSFSIKGDYIYTDFKEGYICVDYESDYSEDGEYQVPDDVDLLRGMAEYIKAMHWEARSDRHEQNTYNRSIQHLQRAEILLKKAKGKFLLRSIDVAVLKDIAFGKMKIIHTPAAHGYRNIGY